MSQNTACLSSLYDVIQAPLITEKSTILGEYGKYTFLVHPQATKPRIKEAVESIFSVKVASVNVVNQAGKRKRFRGRPTKRPDMKKAIVTLVEGQSLDLTAKLK